MKKEEPEILEGEYESNTETALAAISRGHDLVLGTEAAHKSLEYRAKGLEALRIATIRALKPKDFHSFGGNWWLQSSGVSKVSEIYGIHYDVPKFSKEWKDRFDEDRQEVIEKSHFIIKCEITAVFNLDSRSYTATGSASTRDDFFKRKDSNGVSQYQHPLNVDEEDVRKKAETNARARALIGLGIANFTPDELAQAGLDITKSTAHDYKTGAPKSEPTEKQIGFIRGLFEKKVLGINASDWFDWFEKQKVTGSQASYLIEWLKERNDSSIDYEEQFKGEYKNIIAGKYAKPKDGK